MTTIGSPDAALDLHLRMWDWIGTPAGVEMCDRYMEGYGDSQAALGADTMHTRWPGRDFSVDLVRTLNRSMTFYIDQELVGPIVEAASSMPAATLEPEDLVTPAGLLVFPEAFTYESFMPEGATESIPLRAIGWRVADVVGTHGDGRQEVRQGVVLYAWADAELMYGWLDIEWDRARLGPMPPVILADHSGWCFQWEWEGVEPTLVEAGTGKVALHIAWLRRFMLTLWTFMAQEIAPPERVAPSRPARRRVQRAGMAQPEDGSIVHVHLRRYESTAGQGGEGSREWSHRWGVRGHWRQITNKATGRRRAVWVHPYVKGPEDKPLADKEAPMEREVYTVEMVDNPSYVGGPGYVRLPALCRPDGSVKRYLGHGTSLDEAVEKATATMAGWATPRVVVEVRPGSNWAVELVAEVGS